MHQIDSRHPFELLGGQMLGTAVAVGCVSEFPRVGLGVQDQIRDRLHRYFWVLREQIVLRRYAHVLLEVIHRIDMKLSSHAHSYPTRTIATITTPVYYLSAS